MFLSLEKDLKNAVSLYLSLFAIALGMFIEGIAVWILWLISSLKAISLLSACNILSLSHML